jgi:competence protein ComEC
LGQSGAIQLAFYYSAVLAGLSIVGQRRGHGQRIRTKKTNRRSTAIMLGVPLVAIALISFAILQLPDGRLHVAFLDVGQGDAILITTPRGQQILVDGGPSPSALNSALGREMPFWDRSIDLLVMTHADADHITGLIEVLDRFRVDGWLDNGRPDDDTVYLGCQAALAEARVPRQVVSAGYQLDLGRESVLEVLHPPRELMVGTDADSNNNSIVMRLSWDQIGFLLTGDIEGGAEQLLLRSGRSLAAHVLKVAHHGSDGSSTTPFLEAVAPGFAVISVGADNRFGHPGAATLERLAELDNVTIHRTDIHGTVEYITDGKRLWIRTEHER